jgi:hypothetical protein
MFTRELLMRTDSTIPIRKIRNRFEIVVLCQQPDLEQVPQESTIITEHGGAAQCRE